MKKKSKQTMFKVADLFTFGNAAMGLLAIMFFIMNRATTGAILILIAILFDFFDGKVAKWMKQQNEIGKQFDSLSDLISFGVAPAILGFTLGLNSASAIVILIFYALCGLYRLARYNVTKSKGFEGIPITISALIIVILSFFISFTEYTAYVLALYAVLGLLMVSKIRVKRLI